MTGPFAIRILAATAMVSLAACDDAANFPFLQSSADTAQVSRAAQSTKLVERDVEAPEVFQVSEAGLWDGRPSLGGVWVAHPDVQEPERVLIRNESNGKFVIGALFRKERETPGPRLQVSSDAAAAVGMIAGSPQGLTVTALRREEIEEAPEIIPEVEAMPAAVEVETTNLDDTIAAAAAAIEATAPNPQPIPEVDAAAPAPAPTPVAAAPAAPAVASGLAKPFVQIGIFSVEANARRTADNMRAAGIIPTVYDQESKGKRFWRVVVGPVTTESDRDEVLKTVKSLGFTDAYFVTN